MDRRHRLLGTPLVAIALVAAITSGCSSPPVSQATSAAVTEPTPDASASTEPGASPGGEPPVSAAPSDGPPVSGPAGIPDKPADVTFEEVGSEPLGRGRFKVTHELTWTAPDGSATEFTIVGVTRCLRNQERFNGKPCLVRGMRIPKDVQEEIKTVDGDMRSTTISWRENEAAQGPFEAVLIRASNDAGESIFTIAWSADVCVGCTG